VASHFCKVVVTVFRTLNIRHANYVNHKVRQGLLLNSCKFLELIRDIPTAEAVKYYIIETRILKFRSKMLLLLSGDGQYPAEHFSVGRNCRSDDRSNPLIFTDASKPLIFTDVSKPLIFTDASKPLIFTDASKPLIFTDVSKPLIFTDASKPLIFTDALSLSYLLTQVSLSYLLT